VVERIRDVPEDAWMRLVTDDSSPFVEYPWLATLEDAGCVGERAGWIPRHLVLEEDGALVAAAPAYVKLNSEGEFVFDWSWADLAHRMGIDYYPKLVVAVPFTPATGTRVLVAPERDRAQTIAIFAKALRAMTTELELSGAHVLFPLEDEARLWASAGFMLRHGVQYHWHNKAFPAFEDFLATLPQKKRTQIRRERKQPAMDGLTLTTLAPEEVTRDVARAMFDLYLTTVDKYYYGRRYLNRRFFELVAERFAHRLS